MPAKNLSAAVETFRRDVAVVASCVSDRPLLATGYRPSPRPHYVSFAPPSVAVPLRVGNIARALAYEVRIEYQIDEDDDGLFEVRTIGYTHHILESTERELLAYHWHPFGVSPVRFPHAHLSSRIPRFDLDAGVRIALADMHIPTGFVMLADVIRLLIVEFGVKPRRADWESILRQQAE